MTARSRCAHCTNDAAGVSRRGSLVTMLCHEDLDVAEADGLTVVRWPAAGPRPEPKPEAGQAKCGGPVLQRTKAAAKQ